MLFHAKFQRIFQIGFLFGLVLSSALCINSILIKHPSTLGNHIIEQDAQGNIISWITPQANMFDTIVNSAWDFIKNKAPTETCGCKGYMISCSFDIFNKPGHATTNNLDMAGLFGEFVESLIPYYAYTGDWSYVEIVREMLDHALVAGLTPSTWVWPDMPYAWTPGGNLTYSGRIEPDKAGEFGLGLLKFYELTNDSKYLNATIQIANVLAEKVREGNSSASPWPFRVLPQDGTILVNYTGNVVGELNFLDALIALNLGNTTAYIRARDIARSFLLNYVIPNNDWRNYFEDYADNIPTKSEMNADETARYLMNNQEWDPNWRVQVQSIWKWVDDILGEHEWDAYGVLPISEQTADIYFGEFSHTARHASVEAQYAAITGDSQIKDQAYRLFSWSSYALQPGTEFVLFSANNLDNTEIWYTDGYADFIRQYMTGLSFFPEWAPANETHLVQATSIVKNITYSATGVDYTTFSALNSSIDTFRINFIPSSIKAGNSNLTIQSDLTYPGYTLTPLGNGDYILKIQHMGENHVVIEK